MIIRKNRKVLLTAAAILGGTVTTSVHADEFTDLYNKVQAFNSRVDSQISANVKLGETVTVPVASIATMEQQVNQHIASTDSILANKGDISAELEAELEAYNARKDAYNTARNEAIRYNVENAGLEIDTSGTTPVLRATGVEVTKINIAELFNSANAKKVVDFYSKVSAFDPHSTGNGINKGAPIRISGTEGVDVVVTWVAGDTRPLWLDPYVDDYSHAFSIDAPNNGSMESATELRFQFVKTGTDEPVNIATMFSTVDFDKQERLAFKSDTGASAMISGVRNTVESGEWEIYEGGYAPSNVVGAAGSVTAFSGSDVSIKYWGDLAILGLFAPTSDFKIENIQLKPIPPEFSEPAPTAKPVTIQKLALPERIVTTEPIPVTTRYIDNPDELPGYQVVRQEGKAGVLTITKTNGVSDGGKITTPMVERVIERGTGVDIVEPIKVEYKVVDTIPYGEQKVIVEGRARVTRNNKERVAGITRIVEVGTAKTEYTKTGTVETRYIPDANTPYGETREFTKGYQGLTTVETTASVDANGNIVNPVTTKTVEEKQDHIIAVGNVKKEPITIPFETKYIDDPTLKKGEEVVEVKGVNGTGYSVIGHEINPQTGELGASQTSTTVTTRPVMALIRRGTKVEETPVVETPVTEATVKETPMTVVAPLLVETPVTETETPVTETPVTETPVTETPVTDKPVTETPKTETPVTETPKTETPITETPTETPVTETPVTETPVTETPVTETPVTETPVTEKPVTETPVTEKPVTETPTTETPVTETPVIETPVTETPVTETPVTEKPVTDKPVTEKPVTETPKTKTPVTETPVTEKPTITKPTLQTTPATATQSTATQPTAQPTATQQTAQTAVKTTQPLPQTGDTSGLSTIVGLVSTITSGLGLTRKRRNKKD